MQEKAFKRVVIQAICWILSGIFICYGILNPRSCTIGEEPQFIEVQERQAFNRQLNYYTKTQIGTNVSNLIQIIIKNAKLNKDDNDKLPDLIIIPNSSKAIGYVTSNNDNINENGFIHAKSLVESQHNYYVSVYYNPITSLIDLVIVEYNKGDINNDSFNPYNDQDELKEKAGVVDAVELEK